MSHQSPRSQQVREKIIQSAQQQFGRHGFAGASIDEIMADAGLTRGGFYGYFQSKGELYAEAVRRVAQEKRRDAHAVGGTSEYAAKVVREYLSHQHHEGGEASCPLIALPNDLSRTDPAVRAAFESALEVMIEIFERGFLPDRGKPARQRTLAMASLCVGSMILARTVDNRSLADELREAALATALDLGQWA